MNGYRYGHGQDSGKGSRGRSVILVLLPTLLLGVTYFLFIEYLLQGLYAPESSLRITARLGGGVLVVLAAIVATAVGYLLVDRFLRPLRILLRVVQGGDVPDSRRIDAATRCREISELYRVVGTLVRQNQAGAKALEELDELRSALATFREEVGRTGQHGIPPKLAEAQNGTLAAISEHIQRNRSQLMKFFSDLRDRVRGLKIELDSLAKLPVASSVSEEGHAGRPSANALSYSQLPDSSGATTTVLPTDDLNDVEAAISGSIERLRKLGTVLTLDVGASARTDGVRVGRNLENYLSELAALEEAHEALEVVWKGRAEELATDAAAAASRAASEAIAMDNRLLNNELKDRLRQLLDSLDSLDRRLGEVEDR